MGVKYWRKLLVLGVLLAAMLGIASMVMALEIGEKAPDFTLLSTTGEKISLHQFQGKTYVLLEFYVVDFAGT